MMPSSDAFSLPDAPPGCFIRDASSMMVWMFSRETAAVRGLTLGSFLQQGYIIPCKKVYFLQQGYIILCKNGYFEQGYTIPRKNVFFATGLFYPA